MPSWGNRNEASGISGEDKATVGEPAWGSRAEPSEEVREAKDRSVRAPSFIAWIPESRVLSLQNWRGKVGAESAPAVGPEARGIRVPGPLLERDPTRMLCRSQPHPGSDRAS